jgi:hypothetical protein
MKSPLKDRYDFKSSKIIKEFIPPKSVVESYFLYSGAIELNLAASDRLVVAHTNKFPIYEFWHAAKHSSYRIASLAENTFDKIKDDGLFYYLQESWWSYGDPFYRAALFFILNRCSSVGMASCGEIQRNDFDAAALSRLRRFNGENFYVTIDKHEDVIDNINDYIESDFKLFLVGKYGFSLLGSRQEKAYDFAPVNHERLFKKLQTIDKKWIVVYKFNKHALKCYQNYNIAMIDIYGNKTSRTDRCEELVIANF